jgi:putative ABC transport system ATP-binding protein
MASIAIKGLTKSFQAGKVAPAAVANLDLDIKDNEFVTLLGPSGCGKTTLFRLLNGTLRPSSGALRFVGRDTAALSPREARAMRRRIGTIHQQSLLVPSLTALDNTLCGALGRWSLLRALPTAIAPARADVDRAMAALDRVGLADRVHHQPNELSGGQQQRVAVARALVTAPTLLLADEPTGALDSKSSEDVMNIFDRLSASGRTLVVITHEEEVAAHAKRVVRLMDGRIEEDVRTTPVGGLPPRLAGVAS